MVPASIETMTCQEPGIARRLVAILSADVAGYSRHVASDDAGTLQRIADHREELGRVVRAHAGRVVDAHGDDLLAEFGSAVGAVQAAAAAQARLAEMEASLSSDGRLLFRMGVHVGEVVEDSGRIAGDTVNIAARLAALAAPGGICVSQAVVDQVARRVPVRFERLGERRLKNIPYRVVAYRVRVRGEERRHAWGWRKRALVTLAGLATMLGLTIVLVGSPADVRRPQTAPPGVSPPVSTTSTHKAIAVLPFVNLSPDPEQEYFSDGLTEEIIGRLTAVESLRVAARTSSFAFKGRDMDVRRIGADLGVGSILEGSVRREGDRLRVTAQLIQVADGFHLWASSYERQLEDVFDIQREIADAIATTLEAELEATPAVTSSATTTHDLMAYELYLRGRHQWVKFRESSVRASISSFEQAIERVPGYAAAWAGLADAYTTLWDHGYDLEPSTYERAEAAARRAVALDDRLADSHAALAYAFNASGKRPEARRAAERALALRPGWSRAHVELGQALVGEGNLARGLEQMRRAAELDPLAAGVQRQLGRYLLYSDELDAALGPLWRSYELNPHDVLTPIWLWETYRRMGDEDGALETSLLLLPGPARTPVRAFTRVVGSERVLRWLVEAALWWEPGPCGRNAYGAAFWLAALDEADRMFACLEEAQRQRFGILTIARIDPIFEPYRSDPRFRALFSDGSRSSRPDQVPRSDDP